MTTRLFKKIKDEVKQELIQEFISLTNLSVSYDEYTNTIEPKYMTSTLDKQDFCKRYININTTNIKPLAKELKEIKEAIKDFKGNRSFAKREEKKIRQIILKD